MRDLSQELDEKQLKWILSQLQEIDLNYYGDSEVEECIAGQKLLLKIEQQKLLLFLDPDLLKQFL